MERIECKHCHADIPPQDRLPRHQGHCFQCWNLDIPEMKADRDAGWAAADALSLVLRNTGHILRVPAAEYVPAIGDAFTELDKGLVAYTAARAKRTT